MGAWRGLGLRRPWEVYAGAALDAPDKLSRPPAGRSPGTASRGSGAALARPRHPGAGGGGRHAGGALGLRAHHRALLPPPRPAPGGGEGGGGGPRRGLGGTA
eukprot:2952990-Pleurochrysis_carterae.AAC.1